MTNSGLNKTLRIILGNQLFEPDRLPAHDGVVVFMAEDMSLCTDVAHHKQKLVLFLAAMRNYADLLRERGFEVCYHELDPDDPRSYEDKLTEGFRRYDCGGASCFEVEDRAMEARLAEWSRSAGVDLTVEQSPMFLCSRARFTEFVGGASRIRMAEFYREERLRLELLLDDDGGPAGGRWSLDADNRKRLPARLDPPPLPDPGRQPHVDDVTALVERHFPDHPGDAGPFWLPLTRAGAQAWLADFVAVRLEKFGDYEDAISTRSRTVFHSVLSPVLNLGLITPDEVIGAVMDRAREREIPINSLEGFVRQVIGWREFVRGVYREFGEQQAGSNFWQHDRRLTTSWYDGTTGIEPLDEAIGNACRYGWDHHIARLMVVGNLMNLAGIAPGEAWRWFMEMYVDSSDWVMTPNVYGMALFSDGGIFATKPYVCGSNYLLKMSDYKRGDWCDTVDGLYWRFVDQHRDYFAGNPRLAMMPKMFDRLDNGRRQRISEAAERFIDTHTRPAD